MADTQPQSPQGEALLRGAMACAVRAEGLSRDLAHRFESSAPALLRDDDASLALAMAEGLAKDIGAALLASGVDEPDGSGVILTIIRESPLLRGAIHARAVEARLCRAGAAIGLLSPELPERLVPLVEGPAGLAQQAAMAAVVGQSRFLGQAMAFRLDPGELPVEARIQLVRTAVARLQEAHAADPMAFYHRAEALLAPSSPIDSRAERFDRLCFTAGWPSPDEDWRLGALGPSLSVTMLAHRTGLPESQLLLYCLDPGLERLTVVLRGVGLEVAGALQFLADIASLAGLDPALLIDPDAYIALQSEPAWAMIYHWRNSLLASGWSILPMLPQRET